jgi:hypothetical protein
MVFSMGLVYSNCTKENLVPLSQAVVAASQKNQTATVDAGFCTDVPVPAQQKIRYLFILDHSSLNQVAVINNGNTSNSDPTGSRRYGALINFVQNLVPSPQVSVGFDIIDFSDSSNTKQVAGLNTFDTDANDFINIATSDWEGPNQDPLNPAPTDGGYTDYNAALQAAYTLIQQDLQNQLDLSTTQSSIVSTNYILVFVTAGTPVVQTTVDLSGNTLGSPGTSFTEDYTTLVKPALMQILGLKSDPKYSQFVSSITLNTAFYYNTASLPTDAAVSATVDYLKQMALDGNGTFQNSSGAQVLFQSFAPPIISLQSQLVDVFIENKNAIYWNGLLMQDSDGDGIPDVLEAKMGSNPQLSDSDGNGVSDLVEGTISGQPCAASGCSQGGRNPFVICAGFNPQVDSTGLTKYQSTSNDGLNDCEKYVLGANYKSFNSSGSLIPDFMALKNGISIQPGNPYVGNAIPFADSLTNYSKLKMGLPLSAAVTDLTQYKVRVTNLQLAPLPTDSSNPKSGNLAVSCYHINVSNIAVTGDANTIRVSLVMNSAVGQDKPYLKVAEARLPASLSAQLTDADFK